MKSMKNVICFVFLIIFICSMTNACREEMPQAITREYEPKPLEFDYLSIFRSKMDLPGLFVGQNKEYSSGCLKCNDKADTVNAAGFVDAEYLDEAKIEMGIKLALKATIQKAGEGALDLDFNSVSDAIDKWHVVIYNMDYVYIDPVKAIPNFNLSACVTPELVSCQSCKVG